MSAQLVSIPLKQLQTVQHARKEKEHRIAETVACSHIQHSIYSHYFWIFTAFVDYKVQNKICKNCQHRISLRKLGERIKRIEFNNWIIPYWRSCSLKSPYEKKKGQLAGLHLVYSTPNIIATTRRTIMSWGNHRSDFRRLYSRILARFCWLWVLTRICL